MANPRALLILAWVAGFTLIDSSIVSLALPDIAANFDRSVGELAWVSTGFLLALAASLLAAGRLADRFSARWVMVAGAAAFGITSFACGVAPSFELLVASRVAQGAAGGVLYTVSLAIAATAYPPERRATAISIYFTSGALGAVIGPVIGGWLTDLGGWRLAFLAQLPIPVLLIVMTLAVLPRVVGPRQPFDILGVVSAGVFVAATTYAMLQLPIPGGTGAALLAAAIALAALAAFVMAERRSDSPAVRLSIFRNSRFVVSTVAGAGAWFAIVSSTVYVALYLQLGRGFDATQAGLVLLATPAVGLAFLPFAGTFIGRLGVDRSLLFGLLVLLIGSAAMVRWGVDTDPLWLVVVLFVGGAGLAVTLVASATDALSQFEPAEAGTGSAVFNSLRQIGAAFGVAGPAVAFELVAQGSRATEAALAGSTAAFILRAVVLAIPLLLVATRFVPALTNLRADRSRDSSAP